MTWEIIVGIITLVGFIISIVTPLIRLTSAMIKLNANMENLGSSLESLTTRNTESHRRIWEHNEEQDQKLEDHEHRITKIETKMDIMHPESR